MYWLLEKKKENLRVCVCQCYQIRLNSDFIICRREKFEQLLNEYQSEVDVYQEKEVPRHLEDIKKVVAQLEQLSENLEKSKEEAMVSQETQLAWCTVWILL